MMKISWKGKVSVLLLLWAGNAVFAQQNFKYRASIPAVDSSGFYIIALSPDLLAKSANNQADLRITDSKARFVPYINGGDLPKIGTGYFKNFPRVQPGKADTGTVFIVTNSDKKAVNNLWVHLKNTEVTRTVNLLGSDDQQSWFAIREDILLANTEGPGDADSYNFQIAFPLSTYHYFKILVNDRSKAPINILAVSGYESRNVADRFVGVPVSRVWQQDSSNHTSYVHILFKTSNQLNKLHLNIVGKGFFKRHALIYSADRPYDLIKEIFLQSGRATDIGIDGRFSHLIIAIGNDDDRPLQIQTVTAFQRFQYIVAHLEPQENYTLLVGDEKATTPSYDLKFFADSIGSGLKEINHGAVVKSQVVQHLASPKKKHTILLWLAIAVAIGLMLLLTLKMASEVSEAKEK